MTMTATAPFRCHACGKGLDTMPAAERHVDTEHGGGRIEFVLEQREKGERPSAVGTKLARAEDSGVRARSAPSEGTDPALHERPSDDARAMYQPPKDLPKKRTRRVKPRASVPTPGRPVGEDLPAHATPEEREAFRRRVAELKRIAEEHAP